MSLLQVKIHLNILKYNRSGNNEDKEAKGVWESEGMEVTRRTKPSKSTEQSFYELTNTEAARTGPT